MRFFSPFFLLFFIIISIPSYSISEELSTFPVLYKGRFRSAEAYGRLWLYDYYHSPTIKSTDLPAFKSTTKSPLPLILSLSILGNAPYQKAPLFWIGSAELKKYLKLPLKQDRFSFFQLSDLLDSPPKTNLINKKIDEEWGALRFLLAEFNTLKGAPNPIEEAFKNRWRELLSKQVPLKEARRQIDQEYPLIQRLHAAGSLFKTLPSRYADGEWFSLEAINAHVIHPTTFALQEIGNFTLFSDEHFKTIRDSYHNLQYAYNSSDIEKIESKTKELYQSLAEAYAPLAGKVALQAYGKTMRYPTLLQLQLETFYVSYPWIPFLILTYSIAAIFLLISYKQKWSVGHPLALSFLVMAILSHTLLLAMRSYILGRPPVSNMFETVLYVPWVAASISLSVPLFRRNPLVLIGAALTAIILLIILEVTDLNQSLDQVQAVLDSQFWLLIHVLMVVGSYGIFILGALLGHFYLSMFLAHRQETPSMKQLSAMILQSLYIGTLLLISGTILGGVWAAESWGRFWDWDPKESWAFISSCFYLVCIHAYRFGRIGSFGIAFGSILGALAISFTWYGVNYILGTGLHSYGFGSGGEIYYYAFLLAESLFLLVAIRAKFKNNAEKNPRVDLAQNFPIQYKE